MVQGRGQWSKEEANGSRKRTMVQGRGQWFKEEANGPRDVLTQIKQVREQCCHLQVWARLLVTAVVGWRDRLLL